MRGRIMRMVFLAAVLVSIAVAAARPAAFEDWPKGAEPKEVGARIVKQFMSTEPEGYQAKGFTGGNYGGGKYVVYSVASLWVNALEYASLIKDADLQRKLTSRLHPFYPGGAKQDKVTKPRHVDFNIFGAVPLESEKARHLAPFPAEALAQAGWTEYETTCQRHVVATLSNHFKCARFSAVEVQLQDRDFSPGSQQCGIIPFFFRCPQLPPSCDFKAADSRCFRHSTHSHPHGTPSH